VGYIQCCVLKRERNTALGDIECRVLKEERNGAWKIYSVLY